MKTVAVTTTRLFEVPDELIGHFKGIALADEARLLNEWIAMSVHRSAYVLDDDPEDDDA